MPERRALVADSSGTSPPPVDEVHEVPIAELVDEIVDRFSEVARVQSRLQLLLAASRALVDELSLPSLYRRVAELACDLLSTDHAALAVVGTDRSVIQLVQLEPDDECAATEALSLAATAALSRLIGELSSDAWVRVDGAGFESLPEPWPAGFVAVPVSYRGEALAVLLLSESAGSLTDDDEALVFGLALTAGIAVENARLYEESRRREEWLAVAAEVGTEATTLLSEVEALQRVASQVYRLADAEVVAVLLPTTDEGLLEVVAAVGECSAQISGQRLPVLPAGVASAAWEPDVGAGTADRVQDRWRALLGQDYLARSMSVPMALGHDRQALLVIGRTVRGNQFDAVDYDLVASFAHYVGAALEARAARSVQQEFVQLQDRERIARDLHDHVIQGLYATGLRLQMMTTRVQKDAEVLASMEQGVRDIDATIAQLRQSIFNLQVHDSARTGVRAALNEVIKQVAALDGMTIRLGFDGPVDTICDPELTEEVVAVVREAVSNAGRHAQASSLVVQVSAALTGLTVTVTDNGIGMGRSRRRSGLANLRQRAEIRGGTFALDSMQSGGLRLCWAVPVAEPRPLQH